MGLMQLWAENYINTSTQAIVQSNTNTAAYLFDRNLSLGYSTVGYTGATATTITFSLSAGTIISGIFIQNHNLKDYIAYYNGATANSFSPAVSVASNSATSTYHSFNSVTVTTVSIDVTGGMSAASERSIGEIVITNRKTTFERNPSVADWTPNVKRKQILHEMPDGGLKAYFIRDKFQAKLKWSFITESFHTTLKGIYDSAVPLYFTPFPTTTSWDGKAYEVLWVGDFDFKHGDNSKSAGYSGHVELRQTAGG